MWSPLPISSRSQDGFRNYPQGQVQRIGRGASRRQGATVDADGARDDGSRCGMRSWVRTTASPARRLTKRPETLTNDFFETSWTWAPSGKRLDENVFAGHDRKSGKPKWTGTRVDLIFGSNSELSVLAEVYGPPRHRSS